ncbi:pyrimidine 5'-nucleotidase [Candidimonas sp. SYP-B2681]|uniref:pyrimidine 5'-nucleotidase n=1 Tax=Candidimonas sp. SYP-B2681 TaxID=2497686 RepID=UPI000F8902D8|nr:pyrimidine 5'-nucleotidase [Candidimonas sp. SYP-B2681]RTZ43132.1 pyrimidine 5'-nucleotidase [Candidimonas sp. SYP-B2681]
MRALRSIVASHRPRRSSGPAGERETVWLFDLDNTLHDCSKAIFQAIDSGMANAVATSLNIGMDEANVLRKLYWKRYGATVIGMVRHHGVDPHTFLELSHSFDVASMVHCENGLAHKLQQLKGRKILLTNAPFKYARDVLKTLGILQQFECLWAIDHMRLQGQIRPKPSAALMKQVLARLRVPASQVVLVEDTLRNLKSARQVGMRTVHVFHPGTPFSSLNNGRCHYVDVRVNSVGKLLVGRHGLGGPR